MPFSFDGVEEADGDGDECECDGEYEEFVEAEDLGGLLGEGHVSSAGGDVVAGLRFFLFLVGGGGCGGVGGIDELWVGDL